MEAVTQRFIAPPTPAPIAEKKYVYPWEHTELMILCRRIYDLAIKTGYTGTLDEFRHNFGTYLKENKIIITPDNIEEYVGQYEVIPLPLVEQILQTTNKVLTEDVVVAPIPYATVSNLAGGYTAIIG